MGEAKETIRCRDNRGHDFGLTRKGARSLRTKSGLPNRCWFDHVAVTFGEDRCSEVAVTQ